MDFTASDFITDGIDATGDGDLDPSDRQSFGLNIGGDISETTSVSLNMIDSRANIMYDNPDPAGKYENDLRQIGLGVTQKFSDRFQTRIVFFSDLTHTNSLAQAPIAKPFLKIACQSRLHELFKAYMIW